MYQRIVVLHVNNSLQVVFAAKLIFGDDILARQHFVLRNHVILRTFVISLLSLEMFLHVWNLITFKGQKCH